MLFEVFFPALRVGKSIKQGKSPKTEDSAKRMRGNPYRMGQYLCCFSEKFYHCHFSPSKGNLLLLGLTQDEKVDD
jgi:hypothetical protein